MHEEKTKNQLKTQNAQVQLNQYYDCARKHKCPASMKTNLYKEIASKQSNSWFSFKHAMAGVSLVFVTSLLLTISNKQQIDHNKIEQVQHEMQIAMHYMNRISFKSLSSVNNNGLKPGLITPLARSVASL